MAHETKKLGELLVQAALITPGQLQDALRHQRLAGGRMGSNLVALGFITEDLLMDFLARQTGVPRLELRGMDIPPAVLEKIPRRMAEQFHILPVSVKEPKSLVLAMADPLDLNAIDSARFASGMNIEPMVVADSSLKQAIQDQYGKLDAQGRAMEVSIPLPSREEGGLPVQLGGVQPLEARPIVPMAPIGVHRLDPFFAGTPNPSTAPSSPSPFGLFDGEAVPSADAAIRATHPGAPLVVHARSAASTQSQRLDNFQTRTIVMGLVKMLQRRGVLGDDELQRFIANLLEAGELKDSERIGD